MNCLPVMTLQHRLLASSQNAQNRILVGRRTRAICRKANCYRNPCSQEPLESSHISVPFFRPVFSNLPSRYRFTCASQTSRVINTVIDKRAGKSENKRHEESLARGLLAPGRLRCKETAGRGDPASHPEPAAATECRNHRTLCSSQAGKCQYGDLQLHASEHRDRFKNRPHHTGLQENERRKMRVGMWALACWPGLVTCPVTVSPSRLSTCARRSRAFSAFLSQI